MYRSFVQPIVAAGTGRAVLAAAARPWTGRRPVPKGWVWVLAVTAFGAAAHAASAAERTGSAADHYHWRPAAADGVPRPWAVLLPGASGLAIFDDDQHYFRAAEWLNSLGVDALVVDYHRAVRHVPAAERGEAGARMLRVVEDALRHQRTGGRADPRCPAAVIGWSLGGEGGWTAASRPGFANAVVLYYPTTRTSQPYRNVVPVLVLQGAADDVTTTGELRSFVERRAADASPIDVETYADADHGFDIETIVRRRTLRFPPLIGRKATFAYEPAAAAAARTRVAAFLQAVGVAGGECGAGTPAPRPTGVVELGP